MSEKNFGKNSYTLIRDGIVQNPGELEQKKHILIRGDEIIDITEEVPSDIENLSNIAEKFDIIDAEGCIITPGLIDQHIHGGYGCDFNSSDSETIIKFLSNLSKQGITAICPTIITDTPEKIQEQIAKITEIKNSLPENCAKILGLNLEGPFISPEYRGAHAKELTLEPSIENYKKIESDEIRIITLAPELDKGLKLTEYLLKKGVIPSAGHSGADENQITEAFKSGLSHITHLFNAMRPLHHREPGIVGKSLIDDKVRVEVIADHHHLHPEILEMVLRMKPENSVVFISDSLPLNQSDLESTIFGGQKIFKHNEIAVNEEGNFAGSLMFLDSIIRKNLNFPGLAKLLKYCSKNPAENLGMENLGYIARQKTADIVIWEKQGFKIKNTIINGKIVHSSSAQVGY